MHGRPITRGVKGLVAAAAAAAFCFWSWTSLREWAQSVSATAEGALGAGWTEMLLASLTGAVSMPVLLWAGMRLLGERDNHLLVLGGTAAWWVIGGHIVEDAVSRTDTVLFLALFVALGALFSLVGFRPQDA